MLQVIKNNDELQLHQDFKISEKVAFYSKDYDSKDFKLKKIGNIVKLTTIGAYVLDGKSDSDHLSSCEFYPFVGKNCYMKKL